MLEAGIISTLESELRWLNDPCVLVQTVSFPSWCQSAVAFCGSM